MRWSADLQLRPITGGLLSFNDIRCSKLIGRNRSLTRVSRERLSAPIHGFYTVQKRQAETVAAFNIKELTVDTQLTPFVLAIPKARPIQIKHLRRLVSNFGAQVTAPPAAG